MNNLQIIIVEKTGILKSTTVKDFHEENLYKKCGFKKAEGFIKQTVWKLKTGGEKYEISLYAKKDGRANTENKYDFPPPVDSTLFFGSCALVAKKAQDSVFVYADLSIPLWDKLYEKLFGGFEDLSATAKEDEAEEDELDNIPKERKTKEGYLKDGFVIDSGDTESLLSGSQEDDEDDDDDDDDEDDTEDEDDDDDMNDLLEDIGSELSEEEYDYDSDKEKDKK